MSVLNVWQIKAKSTHWLTSILLLFVNQTLFAKESDVIEWAKANHPVEHMQDVIIKEIENKLTPKNVEVEGLPWVEEEESSEE